MKKILALLLLVPSVAFGQGIQIPPPAGTPRALATPGTIMTNASGDVYGNTLVSIAGPSGGAVGANTVNVVATPGATSFLKLEDAAAASGDAGVAILGVANEAYDQMSPSSGDYIMPTIDRAGRVAVGFSPAGVMFNTCGTATATTADVAIKAAVASNRNYITSVTCSSSDADNATNINFKDGSTVIAVGGVNQMATTSSGTFHATFPSPLRLTANTAFNFNTAVSTSSVICCASGYISVN